MYFVTLKEINIALTIKQSLHIQGPADTLKIPFGALHVEHGLKTNPLNQNHQCTHGIFKTLNYH